MFTQLTACISFEIVDLLQTKNIQIYFYVCSNVLSLSLLAAGNNVRYRNKYEEAR